MRPPLLHHTQAIKKSPYIGDPAICKEGYGRAVNLDLVADRSACRPHRFAHDYIRELAYAEAGEARCHLFHRRAIRQLLNSA